MLRINQIKIPLWQVEEKSFSEREVLYKKLRKLLGFGKTAPDFKIVKKSIDARKGEIRFIYSVEIAENELEKIPKIAQKKKQWEKNRDIVWTMEEKTGIDTHEIPFAFNKGRDVRKAGNPPVVVGSGPAGLFCALTLSEAGLSPILIERGKSVDERILRVEDFWKTGRLDTECNVQFGEGGAGTFSDGKLNTMAGDRGCQKNVLKTLVKYGAPEEICYINKPHVGTDRLSLIVKNIRNEIIRLGGQVLFDTKLCGLDISGNGDDRKIRGIIVEDKEGAQREIRCENLVLALGHSARDTFSMLRDAGLLMEKKSFAIGVRAEHLQEDIDRSQYGRERGLFLPAADYKLTAKVGQRSVYSFCMCPGGYVVNSSSEAGMLNVNGMSYSDRGGKNANSALIVSVTPEDFPGNDVLSGVEFQRKWEALAYMAGNGAIPVQLYGDFCQNTISKGYGRISSCTKGNTSFANLRECLPEYVSLSLTEGMKIFGGKIKGYDREDVVFSGVETRTSSPVRMLRGEDGQSSKIGGIYPCGEGAGYAGGITSAAMDGMRTANKLIQTLLI